MEKMRASASRMAFRTLGRSSLSPVVSVPLWLLDALVPAEMSGAFLRGPALRGKMMEGTCSQEVVMEGLVEEADVRAALRRVSELPPIEPLQSPRMCMLCGVGGVKWVPVVYWAASCFVFVYVDVSGPGCDSVHPMWRPAPQFKYPRCPGMASTWPEQANRTNDEGFSMLKAYQAVLLVSPW